MLRRTARTVFRSFDAARAFTFPWGTEGDIVEASSADRNQVFFVLMTRARRYQRRSARQQHKEDLTASPLTGWEGAKRLGGDNRGGAARRPYRFCAWAEASLWKSLACAGAIQRKVLSLHRPQPPKICAQILPSINISLRSFAQPRKNRVFLL